MKATIALLGALTLLGAEPGFAESSVISPNGSRPAVTGAPENFTGSVFAQPLQGATDSMPSTVGHVTFAPVPARRAHAIRPDKSSS